MEPQVLVNVLAEFAGLEEELVTSRAAVARRDRRRTHLRELDAELARDDEDAAGAAQGARLAVRRRESELRELAL